MPTAPIARARPAAIAAPHAPAADLAGKRARSLAIAALGIVYGDIGTSPLYSVRECFRGEHAVAASAPNVFGVLSLVFWSLIIVVSIKYLLFILRADNCGEGGILALMSLVRREREETRPGGGAILVGLGLFGAALLYGDGMITPAISVLSAVEGLGVATAVFHPFLIPITVVILAALFAVQYRGTAAVAAVFGPIMLAWFLVCAILGIAAIVRAPGVLAAASPLHAVDFFARNGRQGFLVLGSVFLVVTGGEALYADMGHFGREPIRRAWFAIVLPALLLNYFGQGALLLLDPRAADNPFYHLAPGWALYPMVGLATIATIIASQAVVSGAFSLTRQAVQLGYGPRIKIDHTSGEERGQIYVPLVNWVLMVATIGLVLGFRSSDHLANAYGVAVTTTMVITTVLAFFVTRELWHWRLAAVVGTTASLLVIDLAFFGAHVLKVSHGGWFPLVIAALVYLLMTTWQHGRRILARRLREDDRSVEQFMRHIAAHPPARVRGTAVFLTAERVGIPSALLTNMRHNSVLHDRTLILTIVTEDVPRVAPDARVEVTPLGANLTRILARVGFMESPNVLDALRRARAQGVEMDDPRNISFFVARLRLLPAPRPAMPLWREWLFILMARNAHRATDFFRIPADQVMEVGALMEL